MKALLIAEKSSVAQAISNVYEKIKANLGYEIDITYAQGHIIGLLEPDEYKKEWGSPWTADVLPIVPDTWQTKITNSERYNEISRLFYSNRYDFIINAGDADREGQLLIETILVSLGLYNQDGNTTIPIYRLWINDTTDVTIANAFYSMCPNSDYSLLAQSGYLRLYMDWIIGINLSRAASVYTNHNMNIGRVLTPTLSLICERENEFKNFNPEVYIEIEALFNQLSGYTYIGTLMNTDNQSLRFFDLKDKEIKNIKNSISGTGVIVKIDRDKIVTKPPLLLNLAELQKICAEKFGLSPTTTLDTAQALYEKKLISYPRTDSRYIFTNQVSCFESQLKAASIIPELTAQIQLILTMQSRLYEVLSSERYVKNTSDSHPALTVTNVVPDMQSLSEKEKAVYITIALSMVAIFLEDNIREKVDIITQIDNYYFKTSLSHTINNGWKDLYNEISDDELNADKVLQGMRVGDQVSLIEQEAVKKQTTPPKRYTYSTIISAMQQAGKEEFKSSGLGTPATRGEILNKLIKYNYVKARGKKQKTLMPTDEGMLVFNTLNNLKDQQITSPALSSVWEQKINHVECGKLQFNDVYNELCSFISSEVLKYSGLPRLEVTEEDIGVCPQCNKNHIIYGTKYVYCQGVKENTCDFVLKTEIYGTKISSSEMKNLITNGKTNNIVFYPDDTMCLNILKLVERDIDGERHKKKLTMEFGTLEDREKLGVCPKCNNGYIVEGLTHYYCTQDDFDSKCGLKIDKHIGKKVITTDMMKEILQFGHTINDVKIKWNGSSSATSSRLKLDENFLIAPEPYKSKTLCKCPLCYDGVIVTHRYGYKCSNFSVGNCKLTIPLAFLDAKIDDDDALQLLKGNSITKKITFKSGNSAIKELRLVYDKEKNRYTLKF